MRKFRRHRRKHVEIEGSSEIYGIPVKEIARICGVSIKTAQRWKAARTVPPMSARMPLAICLGRQAKPGAFGSRAATLTSPDGWETTMSNVLSSPLLPAQMEAYQSENRHLKAKRDAYEDQPRIVAIA